MKQNNDTSLRIFKYILLRMYPFDKIMLQEAFNALDINYTLYKNKKTTKKNQGEQNHLGTNLI